MSVALTDTASVTTSERMSRLTVVAGRGICVASENTDGLNEFQERRLSVTCRHIDKLLSDIENVLWQSSSKSPFPKYIPEIPPAQRRVIEDYIARIRQRLVRALASQNIPLEPPSIPARRSLHTTLTFIDIAVEELRPRYMRGYGEVPSQAAAELNGIVGELQSLVSQLDAFVQSAGPDLGQRLQALEQAGTDVGLLRTLEHVITQRGLVEFRGTLDILLERLEDKSFEIAIFGRVSSGKSSLLNHIVRTDILPIGVTPITAVPTRVMYGERPQFWVWFAEGRQTEDVPIERLPEFVTDQLNPGNAKHVSKILVQIPSPALHSGVVFVDTPGLGSLATKGAAETLAYLPRCDLGVVLIDAGSTLTEEDAQTVQTLYRAGIPANVLLSKADLLSESDREKLIEYVKEHLRSQLGLELSVRAVSVMPGRQQLLESWIEQDLEPLYARRQDLVMGSLRRKTGLLREAVIVSLRARLNRDEHTASDMKTRVRSLDATLRQATARIEEAEAMVNRVADQLASGTETVINRITTAIAEVPETTKDEAFVRSTLAAFIQAQTKTLYDALLGLGRDLSRVLYDAAGSLDLGEPAAETDFEAFLRGMPSFDTSQVRLAIRRRPTAATLLPKKLAQRAVEKLVRAEIGEDLKRMMAVYSEQIRYWGKGVVSEFRRIFNASADTYRAQLERIFRGTGVSIEERNSIEADFQELDASVDVEVIKYVHQGGVRSD